MNENHWRTFWNPNLLLINSLLSYTVKTHSNSNSEGKRKTVRVIGVNFSEILIKGKEIYFELAGKSSYRGSTLNKCLNTGRNVYFHRPLIVYWNDRNKRQIAPTKLQAKKILRPCLHGVGDPGLVGLVSFVFTLWGTQNKRNLPH